MTRLTYGDNPGPKRKGTPFASPSPKTDEDSLLDFYFGHPTSVDESPVGLGRTASDMDDDLG